MTDYRTYSMIKQKFEFLNFCREAIKSLPIEKQEVIKERLNEPMREIRRLIRLAVENAKPYESCDTLSFDSNSGESCTFYYKVEAESREEVEEYCNEVYKQNQIYSPYDCTGQIFCSGIRFAHMKDNIYLIRQRMSRDV